MDLPTLFNTRTTVVDMSTAVFGDDAESGALATAGVATASSVALYQSGDALAEDSRTWALIPLKIDLSGADTFEFSFKYDRGTYVPTLPEEALELGFMLNAGDLAGFNPVDWTLNGFDPGIGGVLMPAFNFQRQSDGRWQVFVTVPPRTEYPSGDVLVDNEFFGEDAGNTWLSEAAYTGVSTITFRVRLKKGTGTGGVAATLELVSLAEDGNVVTLPASEALNANGVFELWDNDISGTSTDPLVAPYVPLTLTPFVRRFSYHDVANNPMTLSDLTVTVGSSVNPVFWTDLQGCVEG